MKHISHPLIEQFFFDVKAQTLSEERIAKTGVNAYLKFVNEAFEYYAHYDDFVRALKSVKDDMLAHAKEHTVLKNALDVIFPHKEILKFKSQSELMIFIKNQVTHVENHFERMTLILPKITADKIKEGSVVFTFGHEADIINGLLQAHVSGKKFTVVNLEHRPSMNGKVLAETLAKQGIHIVHHVDLAMRQAMRRADIVLIGADAIDPKGKILSEIGCELVCETAKNFDVPVYVVCDSWRYDHSLTRIGHITRTEHPTNEIWYKPPKNVKVHNYQYEKVDPKLLKGIICEKGIFSAHDFAIKLEKEITLMQKLR